MNYIGNTGIESLLLQSDTYNYIGFAITPWHAYSLKAAVLRLEEMEKTPLRGIVVIKPHAESGFILKSDIFYDLDADCYFFVDDDRPSQRIAAELSGMKYFLNLKKEYGKSFYYLKPSGFRYASLKRISSACPNRKVIAVSIDEGVGIHMYSIPEWYKSSFKEKMPLKKKLILFAKYTEMNVFKEDRLIATDHFVNCELLVKNKANKNIPNQEMLKHYNRAFFSSHISDEVTNLFQRKKYVIFNTQPINDSSLGNGQSIFTILNNCINLFVRHGYDVVVKPHPRENVVYSFDNDHVVICSATDAQEAILAHVEEKPSYIVSFFSTTLISCGIIFDIPAISLNQILINYGNISDTISETCKTFNQSFDCSLLIPNDYEELESLIA